MSTIAKATAIVVVLFIVGLVFGSCVRNAEADGNGPDKVRIQEYGNCLVFTHDTAQGASIAVSCK